MAKRIDEDIRRIPEKALNPPYTGCHCYECLAADYNARLASGTRVTEIAFVHPVWFNKYKKKCTK